MSRTKLEPWEIEDQRQRILNGQSEFGWEKPASEYGWADPGPMVQEINKPRREDIGIDKPLPADLGGSWGSASGGAPIGQAPGTLSTPMGNVSVGGSRTNPTITKPGGTGGAGVKYGATMWKPGDPRPGAANPNLPEPDGKPEPQEPPPPTYFPPPQTGGFTMPAGGLPTTTTATPGSITPTLPVINPTPPVQPPQGDPPPPKIQPEPQVEKKPLPPPTKAPSQPVPKAPQPAPAAGQQQGPRTTQAPPSRPQTQTQGRLDQMWNQFSQSPMSRYDADLVKQGTKVIEDALGRMRQTGMRNLGEHFASRGLTGSSLEGFGVADLESELGRAAEERLFNLGKDQANTWANDRSSWGSTGTNMLGLGESAASNAWNQDFSTWNAQQGYARQDRSQDLQEQEYLARLVEMFGPDVLEGINAGGGTAGGTYF